MQHVPHLASSPNLQASSDEQLDISFEGEHDITRDGLENVVYCTLTTALWDICSARGQHSLGREFTMELDKMTPAPTLEGALTISLNLFLDDASYEAPFFMDQEGMWTTSIQQCCESQALIWNLYDKQHTRFMEFKCQVTQTSEHAFHITSTYGFILTPSEIENLQAIYEQHERPMTPDDWEIYQVSETCDQYVPVNVAR